MSKTSSQIGRVVDGLDVYIDLHPTVEEALPGKGPIPSKHVICGIAPSTKRPHHRRNEPFGSRSWAMIQEMAREYDIYLTNLVKVPWPSGQKLHKKEIRFYYPSLVEEMRIVRPKRILALGSEVASVLCPGFSELREDHGTIFWNPELRCHVVPTYHFSSLHRNPINRKFLARDLERFFTLPAPEKPKYQIVKKKHDLPLPFEGVDCWLDIETNWEEERARWSTITKVGLLFEGEEEVHILQNPSRKRLQALREELKERNVTLIGHNFVFDLSNLMYQSGKPWRFPLRDTMYRSHTAGEEMHSLKHLTTMYTDRPGSRAFGSYDEDAYNAEDVFSTREIEQMFDERGDAPFICSVLNSLTVPIAESMVRGVHVDRPLLEKLQRKQAKTFDKASKRLETYVDEEINWDSADQVEQVLLDNGVKLREKTESGKRYAIGEPILTPLRDKHPIIADYLDYQEAKKYLEFLDAYEEETREKPFLHPKIKMAGARTGRWSMEEPNLQQVPRVGPIKRLFNSRFDDGLMGLADLSGAELRVAALLSGDLDMARVLREGDFHSEVAKIAYKVSEPTPAQRKKSKGVTFGLIYGGSDQGLAAKTGANPKEVAKIKASIEERFPRFWKWMLREGKNAIKLLKSYSVLGRIRDLSMIMATEGEGGVRRKGVNTPVQGTASDILLIILDGVFKLVRKAKLRTLPLFPIHDAFLSDIYNEDEVEPFIEVIGRSFMHLADTPLGDLEVFSELPLVGEMAIGPTWAHCESTNENYAPMWKVEFSTLAKNGVVKVERITA